MRNRRIKRKRVLVEDSQVIYSAETDLSNKSSSTDSSTNNDSDTEDDTSTQTDSDTKIKEADVDNLSDDEVLNYVYFDVQDDIDISTKNKLFQRADSIRQQRESGTLNGNKAETLAKGIIKDAEAFLKSKKAYDL